MEISIRIENIEEVERFLKSRPKKTREELNRAVQKTALLVTGEAKRRTPVDTGRLKTSIRSKTFKSKLAGEVFTAVRYAIPVHENLRARHKVGEAKYLERAAKQSVPRINGFFKKAISDILKE